MDNGKKGCQNIADYYGTKVEFEKEVEDLKNVAERMVQDDTNHLFLKALTEQSRFQFVGANSSSKIMKCFYQGNICTMKTLPLIRFFNLKALLTANVKYQQLFENESYLRGGNIQLIKKIYIINRMREEIWKPFMEIVSSYDQTFIPLTKILKKQSNQAKMPLVAVLRVVKAVAEALSRIHKLDLVHGNVCLNNIFVPASLLECFEDEFNVLLVDVGMHYLYKVESPPSENVIQKQVEEKNMHELNEYFPIVRAQIEFLAPEFKEQAKQNMFEPSAQSDIYQLGLCMLCMCSISQINFILAHLKQRQELQESLIHQKIQEVELPYKKEKIKRMLMAMLDSDPLNRPTADQIFQKSTNLCSKLEKLQSTKKEQEYEGIGGQLQNEQLQGEIDELCDLIKPFLELKKEETVQKLKDMSNHFSLDVRKNKSDYVLNSLKTVDNFIQNTRHFMRSLLIKQCSRMENQTDREQLIYQINEANLQQQQIEQNQQNEQSYFNLLVQEKNKLFRISLFYCLIYRDKEIRQNQKQLTVFEYTQQNNSSFILSTIYLDAFHFLTIDTNLQLKVWNVVKKEPSVTRDESSSQFDCNTVTLLNLSVKRILIYDSCKLRIYPVIKQNQLIPPMPFVMTDEHELKFNEFFINKIYPIFTTEEDLFIVLTNQSHIFLCNGINGEKLTAFSLMNLNPIQRYFQSSYLEKSYLPSSHMVIDDPFPPLNPQKVEFFPFNSSIVSQQQQSIQQQQQQQLNDSRRIKNSLSERIYSFTARLISSISFKNKKPDSKFLSLLPDVNIALIIEDKYLYFSKLKELILEGVKGVDEEFIQGYQESGGNSGGGDRISKEQFIPSAGKIITALFHPTKKTILISITNLKELIFYDFIDESLIIKLHFGESLYDIQLVPLEKSFFILVRDFSSLFLAPIEKDLPYSENDFLRFRDGIIHQTICFPRCLDVRPSHAH